MQHDNRVRSFGATLLFLVALALFVLLAGAPLGYGG